MLLTVRHETLYSYASPVRYSIQYLRMTPRPDAGQRVLAWRIEAPGRSWIQTDAYGNIVTVLSLDRPHADLRIAVHGTVETVLAPGAFLPNDSPLPPEAFLVATRHTEPDDAIRALAARLAATPTTVDGLLGLATDIRERVAYEKGHTDVGHTAAQALALGRGVCQDHAHIFVAACRAAGLPARYISGYLDAGDPGHVSSHAWADVWLAASGWVSLDVTHASLAGEGHCRLAAGRDYFDASPVRGMRQGGSDERMEVSVRVLPEQSAQQQ